VPYGTPGSRAGILTAGASLTPPGMALPRDTSNQTAGATPSAQRRRARYDCAACHY
jgi:hypothetical protein